MAEKADSLSDKLKAISDMFAAKIDQKAAEIEAACGFFLSSVKDSSCLGARDEANNLAHRLAGSSGSMGFPELGGAAKALELSLIAVPGDAPAEARRAICPPLKEFAAAARGDGRDRTVLAGGAPGAGISAQSRMADQVIDCL